MHSCSCWSATTLLLILFVNNFNPQVSALIMATEATELKLPLDVLAAHANSYASANGVQVERRRKEDGSSYFECAPMSLLPNAFPKQAFAQAQSLATCFNELVDRISRDSDFLQATLGGGVSKYDPFTGKLLTLYNKIYRDNPSNVAHTADRLGIHRSDYMLHAPKEGEAYQLKQVELNTIAASFAGLAVNVARLHRYLSKRFEGDISDFLKTNQEIVTAASDETPPGVPENPALSRIPNAMKVAHERYTKRFLTGDTSKKAAIILFVVQEGETNTVDQRMLEFQLWEVHGIEVVRMSLTQLASELEVEKSTGTLKLGDKEIAVVYYRAGYAPTDYPDGDDGKEWTARTMLEESRAAKCPSLGYHLAGTKKVQQELARPGVLERFFSKPEELPLVENMRSAFANLYSLGEDATSQDLAAVQEALSGKQGAYVLKPQREGGGYNFYGDQMAQKLRENTSQKEAGSVELGKQLSEFILMQRLFPPQQQSVLLRGGRVEGSGETVSELGCFGTLVVTPDGVVVHNDYAGFLLRTKFSNIDEGGVASGFATLSSPYLC
jgi:glutathione synthetase